MARHNLLGMRGEVQVWHALRKGGISATIERVQYDILTEGGIKIEVKSAYISERGTIQACAYKAGHTDVRHADIVVILAYAKNRALRHAYVIPASDISVKLVKITAGAIRGKYARYSVPVENLADAIKGACNV